MGDTYEPPLDTSKYEFHGVPLGGDGALVHTTDVAEMCEGGIDVIPSIVGDEE